MAFPSTSVDLKLLSFRRENNLIMNGVRIECFSESKSNHLDKHNKRNRMLMCIGIRVRDMPSVCVPRAKDARQ